MIGHQLQSSSSNTDKLNGETGFSHGSYASNSGQSGGYSNRHPHRTNISINTAPQMPQSRQASGEMTAPGTAYDMNYTPLLPSQLLLGSPFQTSAPQFSNFGHFAGGTAPTSASSASQISPGQQQTPSQQNRPLYTNLNGTGEQQYISGSQSPIDAYADLTESNGFSGMQQMQMQMAPTMDNANSRTIYLGNVPAEASADEILGHVRSGQIESFRLLTEKNCAFIAFLDASSATHFHSDAILKKLNIRGHDIKIGWGKPAPVPTSVALAVQQQGASRNVYLGNLPESITENEIREDLGKFGPIDTVKLVPEKSIGFVHFLSISNAVKAVSQLPQDPKWQAPRRVNYGKDRCAYVSKTQQQNAAQYLGIAPGYAQMLNNADRDLISNALAQQSVAAAAVATQAGGVGNLGNRTVYLGNIHPETTVEEICNVIRGGLLHHIRYLLDKHICFVTFVDPTAAASFFALSNVQGLMIHNRRLKIGWGKHSGPLPPAIALAVSGGASRNVYIGNLDESWSEEQLREDFAEYGEIELVNTLREKNCAFVNFTNLSNAIKAIEAIRGREAYGRFKINFGKDRCGNAPRQNPYAQQQQHQQQALPRAQMQHQQQHQQQQQQQQQHQQYIQEVPNRDMLRSPSPAIGVYHSGSTGHTSHSSNGRATSPAPSSYGHAAQQQIRHGHTSSAIVNSSNQNPLSMYLNQLSLQGPDDGQTTVPRHQRQSSNLGGIPNAQALNPQISHSPRSQQRMQHPQLHTRSSSIFNDVSSETPTLNYNGANSSGSIPTLRQPQYVGHGSSLSQNINLGSIGGLNGINGIKVTPPNDYNDSNSSLKSHSGALGPGSLIPSAAASSNTIGGLLAPRNQHSRAVSLPAFSQEALPLGSSSSSLQQAGLLPQPIGHRQQQASISGFGGLGGGSTWGLGRWKADDGSSVR